MHKGIRIPVLILVAGLSTSLLMAAGTQSLHFPVAAPIGANAGNNDLSVGVKAAGLNPIASNPIDLSSTTDTAGKFVAAKAARGLCAAAFNSPAYCVRDFPVLPACGGAGCCDVIDGVQAVIFTCRDVPNGKGFQLNLASGADNFTASAQGTGGNVSHLSVDNKNIYPDASTDVAPRMLLQLRPNGLSGTATIRITHAQGGANPRSANVSLTGSMTGAAAAAAVVTALQGMGLGIVAVNHTVDDANYPLTAFGDLKQASNFVEIGNISSALISDVEVIVPAGMGFTEEGTEGTLDPVTSVPTLSGWGAILAAAVLLTMIFWMHRKRIQQAQA